jgi:hypothetical protein
LSFEGVGIFTDGKLHFGPFSVIHGNGFSNSFSMMIDGRPGDNYSGTYFNLEHNAEHWYSGQLTNALSHGQGKRWLKDGRVFTGEFWCHKLKEGSMKQFKPSGYSVEEFVKYN